MKIPTRARYAVRALCRLALMSKEGPVPLSRIAERESISRQYLSLLFHQLRKAGFVEADRGINGGYRLSRDPGGISLASVIRAVDGPIAPLGCLLPPDQNPKGPCERETTCLTRPAWASLQRKMEEVLESITIGSLINRVPEGYGGKDLGS
ncbi:MAG: Rrf2 family transcriptional regulator [Bacillota bacterium]